MRKWIVVVTFLAACSGGGGGKTTGPANPDPVPMPNPPPTKPDPVAEPKKPDAPVEPAKPDPKAELLAAELAAFEKAKPVFEKNCARCHQEGNKLATAKKRDHFDMTKYPFGGHHAMTISKDIRKSLGIGGGKPTMPYDKKGSVKGDDLALIAAWADAFDASHAAGAHEGQPGHGDHKH